MDKHSFSRTREDMYRRSRAFPANFRVSAESASEIDDVCIVTPGYLSSTPRVVKEADALVQAGYRVRVIFSQGGLGYLREYDAALLREKPWRWTAVRWAQGEREERKRYWRATIRYHLMRRLPARLWPIAHIAECGEGRLYPELARTAAAEPAHLFIGHYPTGLAAAAEAAAIWHARLAYDAEDLHTDELPLEYAGSPEVQRVAFIERKYLPHCAYVTAASPGIAAELERRYDIPRPVTIYNVFPLADRAHLDGQIKDRQGPTLSLYWFSQTIGLDRGISDALRAVGRLGGSVQIHLRGSISDRVKAELVALARECGVAERLYFHPQVSPLELLSRTAEHDVGLALEPGQSTNNAITASNKLFLYFTAGLAVAATDVPGQRGVLGRCPQVGCLYPPGDYHALAAQLEEWRCNPTILAANKTASLAATHAAWNWECESQKIVRCVTSVLVDSHG